MAVDRILAQLTVSPVPQPTEAQSLLENLEDADIDIESIRPLRLARLGQLVKIDKALRPHVVHTADKPEAVQKEITALLKASGGMTALNDSNAGNREKAVLQELFELTKKAEWAQEQKKRLEEAECVGVTCASSMSPHLAQSFDVLVLDEASQMTESLSCLPISSAMPKRMIVVGDPMQLPPVLASTSSEGKDNDKDNDSSLERTLYDRLLSAGWHETHLTRQYRCHPHIAGICSRLFYHNQLLNGVAVADRRALVPGLPPAVAVHCDDGSGQITLHGGMMQQQQHEEKQGESFINRAEGRNVVALVGLLRRHSIKSQKEEEEQQQEEGQEMRRSIGVICAYRAQANYIAPLVATDASLAAADPNLTVKVSTVDAFQGQECDFIIICTTRTLPGKRIAHLYDPKRTNVALSRARHHVFVLGNIDSLREGGDPWSSILKASCMFPSFIHLKKQVEAKSSVKPASQPKTTPEDEEAYMAEMMGL